jgi:ArsR family transcriptional regulator
MDQFLAITKALSDEPRVRALLALREGELCLCQVIELLDLAPSTVSKHMSLLKQAGLVQQRKAGRWHYYRLPDEPSPMAREAINWALKWLADEKTIVTDAETLCCVKEKDLKELTACYSGK